MNDQNDQVTYFHMVLGNKTDFELEWILLLDLLSGKEPGEKLLSSLRLPAKWLAS